MIIDAAPLTELLVLIRRSAARRARSGRGSCADHLVAANLKGQWIPTASAWR